MKLNRRTVKDEDAHDTVKFQNENLPISATLADFNYAVPGGYSGTATGKQQKTGEFPNGGRMLRKIIM